jgi:hypothetical protein
MILQNVPLIAFGTETRGFLASPAVIPTSSVPPNAKQAPINASIDKSEEIERTDYIDGRTTK